MAGWAVLRQPNPAGIYRMAGLFAEHLGRAGYAFTVITVSLGQSTVIGLSCLPRVPGEPIGKRNSSNHTAKFLGSWRLIPTPTRQVGRSRTSGATAPCQA